MTLTEQISFDVLALLVLFLGIWNIVIGERLDLMGRKLDRLADEVLALQLQRGTYPVTHLHFDVEKTSNDK